MWLAVFFIFIDQYSLACVLLPAEELTGFLSIHSIDEQWKVIHRDVASISKTSFPAGT